MKTKIKNIGTVLTKKEQKMVHGGIVKFCNTHEDCYGNMGCCNSICMTPDKFDIHCRP